MGLLRRRPRRGDELRGLVDADSATSPTLLPSFGAGPITQSAASVPTRALGHSVVWRSCTKAATTIAAFPVREVMAGVEVPTPSPVVRDPWPGEVSRSAWVGSAVMSLYLRGAAYLWADGPQAHRGIATSLALLNPDRVAWTPKDGWSVDGKSTEIWPLGPLVNVPFHLLPGSPVGLNPLQFARLGIYAGVAATEYGANFYEGGGVPSAILSPDRDPGPEGAKLLKERWKEATQGTQREPAVLPASVTYSRISVSPQDAAFIEAAHLSDEQVCRYFNMPPSEVGIQPTGSGSTVTYQNRADMKADLLEGLLLPMVRLQEAWSSVTGGRSEVRFAPAGLLRAADTKTRYEAYKVGIDAGIITPDEARAFEDLPPRAA